MLLGELKDTQNTKGSVDFATLMFLHKILHLYLSITTFVTGV